MNGMETRAGRLFGVGVGPGDPELLTLKAARVIAAAGVVAYFAKRGRPGHARRAADAAIAPGAAEIRLEYPYTTEMAADDPRYRAAMAAFYDAAAATLADRLRDGVDVALLCEGDPLFYGSYMHLHARLARDFPATVIPGVSGMSAAWSLAGLPMTQGNEALAVLPGTLPEAVLTARLRAAEAVVIMKIGRNLAKIRAALTAADRLDEAVYVERASMAGERCLRLAAFTGAPAPYFSLILLPGAWGRS